MLMTGNVHLENGSQCSSHSIMVGLSFELVVRYEDSILAIYLTIKSNYSVL